MDLLKTSSMKQKISLSIFVLIFYASITGATTFVLPNTGNVIGEVQYVTAEANESIDEIGKRFDVGYYEITRANPHVNPRQSLVANSRLLIPSQYILPDVPRKGIVINLAEYRLYFFPENENVVITFPVGIGRKGWSTPLGVTKIVSKEANPKWRPTEKLRSEAERNGDFLPDEFPSGPYNPLGQHALRLGWPTFLIHGTNNLEGIGTRVSAGCIRMFPEDIEYLFRTVPTGTPVRVINDPIKIGRMNDTWVMQILPPLSKKMNLKLTLEKKLNAYHSFPNLKNNRKILNELTAPSGLLTTI
ncbi:putative ErfK/YbiS/YcfS/YnhG family protein precursor [Legionella wadsworthii]|uniref:Putative ErfK/YbiS/YcfS/YnhG family protein n=1 Tax=Legionella wadsworthii TaxID=28088 RepID=A0A378LQI7_9GAMM|nr:L,D-transpeptidase family protein [Legionella wadsworthii]STY29196.1 putative ErfK/YbiS/YcfS/YnhG family protein precursor [Legionella wadsworthii]